jgi:hypothetical protein
MMYGFEQIWPDASVGSRTAIFDIQFEVQRVTDRDGTTGYHRSISVVNELRLQQWNLKVFYKVHPWATSKK